MTHLPQHTLELSPAPERWDEGVPLGNGLLGAMLWQRAEQPGLLISLDRTDLWDLTPVPEFYSDEYSYALMRKWHAEGRTEDLLRVYDRPYDRAAPTKIPAGRLALDLGKASVMKLDLARALALVEFAGARLTCFVSATHAVGVAELQGSALPESPVGDHAARRIELHAPAFGAAASESGLGRLGYPAPRSENGADFASFEQQGALGFRFAVHVGWRASTGRLLVVWSIASSAEGAEPATIARARVEAALARGHRALLEEHEAWWKAYWQRSWVRLGESSLERLYYLELYKFGAAARSGAPPIALQGPWTLDNGDLPPWKGDYHHDLNTELCYWPAYAAGQFDAESAFLDWLWSTREECVAWTRRFFAMPGMNVPMTADLLNRQIGGWRQYTHSLTTAAWLSHHFYLHWRYTRDRTFLAERAQPYLRDAALFLEAATNERDPQGQRTLPLSASPEMHDNRPEAWFASMTNYDNALTRFVFAATAELSRELGLAEDAGRFERALGEMPELALGEDGQLLIARGHPLPYSHRHHSHLLGIYPLGLLDPASDAAARRIAQDSLAEVERLGTKAWTGYSFSWLACLWARLGEGEKAARALSIFQEAFVSRNSFHVNGDYKRLGYSNDSGRPFTLEGNCAAGTAIQQMLLHSHGGVLRVFPALPERCGDAGFCLRAEGGFAVTAERQGGQVKRVTIASAAGEPCRLLSPWSGRILELAIAAGESLTIERDP